MLKKLIKRLLLLILILALVASSSIGASGYLMYREAVESLPIEEMAEQISGRENFVSLEDLPDFYLKAVVSVEDRNFYNHKGIDLSAIVRAVYYDIVTMSMAQGGSTITQQLAKNSYFTQDKQLQRKAAEVFMAFDFESTLTKDEILALYVNSIYFGRNYYGIEEAAFGYFEKKPNELTSAECILLAALPHAPSVYSEEPELLLTRAEQILVCMEKDGHISLQQSKSLFEECLVIAQEF